MTRGLGKFTMHDISQFVLILSVESYCCEISLAHTRTVANLVTCILYIDENPYKKRKEQLCVLILTMAYKVNPNTLN